MGKQARRPPELYRIILPVKACMENGIKERAVSKVHFNPLRIAFFQSRFQLVNDHSQMTSTIRSVTTLLPLAGVSYLKWRLTTVRRPKRLIMISSPTLGNTSGTSSGQRYSSGTCSSFLDVTRTMAFMMGKGYHTAPRNRWFNCSCCTLTHRDSAKVGANQASFSTWHLSLTAVHRVCW
jgi:hypothetical protein